jgi:hypothetical protein
MNNCSKTISIFGVCILTLLSLNSTSLHAQQPYQAVNDDATTTVNTPVAIDVLANDIGSYNEYNLEYYVGLDGLLNGQVVVDVSNNGTKYQLKYYPNPNFIGETAFHYTVRGTGQVGNVTVNVQPGPDSDDDGAPDSVELGDTNRDGILDKNQSYVAAFGEYYLEVDTNCLIREFSYNEFNFDIDPNDGIYPPGLTLERIKHLFKFKSPNCTTTKVKIGAEKVESRTLEFYKKNVTTYKYGLDSSSSLKWFNFNKAVSIAVERNQLVISYTLVDGGLGDGGLDGRITDPIAITIDNIPVSTPLVRTGGVF